MRTPTHRQLLRRRAIEAPLFMWTIGIYVLYQAFESWPRTLVTASGCVLAAGSFGLLLQVVERRRKWLPVEQAAVGLLAAVAAIGLLLSAPRDWYLPLGGGFLLVSGAIFAVPSWFELAGLTKSTSEGAERA